MSEIFECFLLLLLQLITARIFLYQRCEKYLVHTYTYKFSRVIETFRLIADTSAYNERIYI